MKTGKCLFLSVFVFLSAVLHAQVLEPADVDIFIKGFSAMDSVTPQDNAVWDNYQEQLEEISESFYIWDDGDDFSITDAEFNALKAKYQKFLKTKVPDELASMFKSMGWNRNGHEKFWTIGFGLMLLMIQEEYDLPGMEKLLELFHKNDLAIVKTIVERFKEESYHDMPD